MTSIAYRLRKPEQIECMRCHISFSSAKATRIKVQLYPLGGIEQYYFEDERHDLVVCSTCLSDILSELQPRTDEHL